MSTIPSVPVRKAIAVALFMISSACSRDLTDSSIDPVGAHDVSITVTVIGAVASGDSTQVHISNRGSRSAYLSRCGTGPLLLPQTFVGGSWTGGVQNFLCPVSVPPEPVEIAAGASLDVARVFAATGRYRITAGIAGSKDFNDVTLATSNAFDVP